jgi:hypothetical protein
MESINVVIDDEVTGSSSKGEHFQPIDTPLDSSNDVTVKHPPPPPPQDEHITPPQEAI